MFPPPEITGAAGGFCGKMVAPPAMSIFTIILLAFALSQIYWAWRGYRLAALRIRSRGVRLLVCAAVLGVYAVLYYFNMGPGRERSSPVRLTWHDAVLSAPFLWWAASSFFAFLLAALLALPRKIAESPDRRSFLGQAASAAVAAPFVAGTYGLLYGRLNLQTTAPVIRLPKLPRAFEGFRICQLSDLHIGPFMPADEIRRYAAIANEQKADIIVLTGDFVTFDPSTQHAVVDALSGLRAPYGVWGCLGNHDMWTGVEASITELFRQTGVRMLRGANAPIAAGGDSFNLIGVDFQSPRRFGPSPAVTRLLGNIERLVDRDRVNILLSHNPDTFDRAAQLGIDFSLAGHTHGGQVALEFISPEIAPSRLVTPYVAGWFQQPGGQLYVNRGIGTIFIPMRIGAPPEITTYKLSRG
jgi:uncharacterized protein